MWFKNLQVFRLTAPIDVAALQAGLAAQAFTHCSSIESERHGWIAPRDAGMVHVVNRQLLLALRTEKKLLPKAVVAEATKQRAAELEAQQGFKPGRKQMKEITEQVTDELLPQAFSTYRTTRVWIDPVNRWLVVDAASAGGADLVLKMLLKSMEVLPVGALRTERSPLSAMTDWLAADEAPDEFTVDTDAELQATGEGKATVRFVRHTIEAEDARRHIASGKQCTRLAMTWADRVSFVLTESGALKRVKPLDVLQEKTPVGNDDDRFDTDFALMTGELAQLFKALVVALDGEASA